MKINVRNLIVVFLVALLGGFLGVYGGNVLYNEEHKVDNKVNNSPAQVTHTNKQTSSLKEGIQKAYETVVEITAKTVVENNFFQPTSSTSMGSGVIISEDGYIITNNHVIEGANEITVKTANGESYVGSIVGADAKSDIAVIKIEANGLKFAEISDSDALEVGDDAIAIGNPLGTGIAVSNGIISALDKEVVIENETMYLIQTNAAINQGNSGGGLFDINGNLIGIVNAKKGNSSYSAVSVEGLGYAIPSNTVVRIANDLMENGYVKNRPTLGIKVAEISYDIEGFPRGLYITEVIEGGAAEKAGLHTYDRIVEFNGKTIDGYSALSGALNSLGVDETVSIKVIRNNQELELNITLQANTNAQ